ncbi:MAG: heme o synthase, partial [candidate division Zixibacteria bacterium]|nr:heme o synthase [candidate division Zixibacteria bacterium]
MTYSKTTIQSTLKTLTVKIRLYWRMTKSLQTGLLLSTGLAGYMSARCPVQTWQTLLALAGSLFLAISGSTVINMVYDRDIDARMPRTQKRPLPKGQVSVVEAFTLGAVLSVIGIGWATFLSPLYGLVVFAGLFFDVVVYTIWLKRRTPWSIIWGGIAGGMPALAGRVLGLGTIDWIGLALALAVLLWIPTHIMTFSLRYREDYAKAGVPTFPAVYGERITSIIIALSSIATAIAMAFAAYGIGITWGYMRLLIVLSCGLLALAISSMVRPSFKMNFGLFKFASLYMLSSMLL